MEHPKVFISYSRTSPARIEWVIDLAERLSRAGVHVMIDEWDLKPGQDLYHFMETMVKDSEVCKVLMILDKIYTEKADGRLGGVGTETQIISPQIYENATQEKFVPVIAEVDEDGKPYRPTYLKSIHYIDLHNSEDYEKGFEKLLRIIHNKPTYSRPKIGSIPSYLDDDRVSVLPLSVINRGLEQKLRNHPERVNGVAKQFFGEVFELLKEYVVGESVADSVKFGQAVHDNIIKYTDLRNEFISFLSKVTSLDLSLDAEELVLFFAKQPQLLKPWDDQSRYFDASYAIFKIVMHELFLYSVMVCLKNRNYKFLHHLLHAAYFTYDSYSEEYSRQSFDFLQSRSTVMDEYYRATTGQRYLSIPAKLFVERLFNGFSKQDMVQADMLLHYVAAIRNSYWFPMTYIYAKNRKFEFFIMMQSMSHFEKVKALFGVHSVDEMKNYLEKEEAKGGREIGYSEGWDYVLPVFKMVDKETLGIAL